MMVMVDYDGYGDGCNGYGHGYGGADLGRRVESNRRVLIENVDNIEFYVYPCQWSAEGHPSQDDITGDKIRSIQISILVRASETSLGYLDTQTYTPASGLADWTPPLDKIFPSNFPDYRLPQHFRRRMQVITVDCRNMGW